MSEEEPGLGLAFGESDADLAHLVPFHHGDCPGQAVPLHLVADHGLAADFMGDEATQRGLAVDLAQLEPVQRGDGAEAVVAQVDGEMAARARASSADAGDDWEQLLAEGEAYIAMALDPEVRRIVLLDGPAFLGDPSHWPSQNACLQATKQVVEKLIAAGVMKSADIEAAARLLSGAALNAALWVAASDDPQSTLPKATHAFRLMAEGFLSERC